MTPNTDPDWVPIMKRAAAIVTDHGGRTSHAAIVSRELGLPAIVGTGNGTELLHDQQEVTVSCAGGDEGVVYEGRAQFAVEELHPGSLPQTRTKIMLNMANPAAAFRWWRLPADGVGLARMEFVISNAIKVHPLALTRFDEIRDETVRAQIEALTKGYADKREYFVDKLAQGLSRIAAVYFPNPVIIRMSDFKTNEYANLLGGRQFEPEEENPMIGFRGASRYYSPLYRDGFELECRAIRKLREEKGFANVKVMIPFCRTPQEADKVLEVMAGAGLERGRPRNLRDVRNSFQRHPCRRICPPLRRLLHRLERPDATDARYRPRLRTAVRAVQRTRSGGGLDDRERHREGSCRRREGRIVRTGAKQRPRLRCNPRQGGHRFNLGDARQLLRREAACGESRKGVKTVKIRTAWVAACLSRNEECATLVCVSSSGARPRSLGDVELITRLMLQIIKRALNR